MNKNVFHHLLLLRLQVLLLLESTTKQRHQALIKHNICIGWKTLHLNTPDTELVWEKESVPHQQVSAHCFRETWRYTQNNDVHNGCYLALAAAALGISYLPSLVCFGQSCFLPCALISRARQPMWVFFLATELRRCRITRTHWRN